jgi:hypothetical protein
MIMRETTSATTFVAIRFVFLASLIAPAMLGCTQHQYELEMQVTEGKLERKITTQARQQHVGEKVVPDLTELNRIAELYETELTLNKDSKRDSSNVQKVSFAKLFSDRTPSDLGGSGTFTHWPNSLGSASTYLERVRGDDDLAAHLEHRQTAINRLVDLMVGWFAFELGDAPEATEVRSFLDTTFRHDLMNINLYLMTALIEFQDKAAEQQESQNELDELKSFARAIQYCVERQYVTPQQLPAWGYALEQASQNRYELVLQLVQRMLATKIGIPEDQPVPASIARLSDFNELNESVSGFLRQTDEYREIEREWEQTPAAQRSDDPPVPTDVLGELVLDGFLKSFFMWGGDQLVATFTTHVRPMMTNGKWDEEKGCVEWKLGIPGLESDESVGVTPDLLYAVWVEPDRAAQSRMMGKVALVKEDLYAYCLWRAGLPANKAEQWDTFVSSWTPGPELPKRILAFRFDDEPADVDPPAQSMRARLAERIK